MTNEIYPCLWFDGQAKAAALFYCSVFKNARIIDDTPMAVTFELNGKMFMGLNGGPQFKFNESISFVIPCENQEEIDYYWSKLTSEGGQESMCGWLKDKFGMSWQVIPKNMGSLINDPIKGQKAVEAMMKMKKLNIEELANP